MRLKLAPNWDFMTFSCRALTLHYVHDTRAPLGQNWGDTIVIVSLKTSPYITTRCYTEVCAPHIRALLPGNHKVNSCHVTWHQHLCRVTNYDRLFVLYYAPGPIVIGVKMNLFVFIIFLLPYLTIIGFLIFNLFWLVYQKNKSYSPIGIFVEWKIK